MAHGKRRLYLLGVLVFGLALPRAPALLNMSGTRNQIFVFGSVAVGYNSNIFSDSTARGDSTINVSAGVDLKRRAGIIAVNATARLDYNHFGRYPDENAFNPYLYLELTKTTGRMTGDFTASAFRESRSDSAVNLRTNSWNYPLELNLKYPINQKFYVTSQTGFLQRNFAESAGLVNYTDYSEGLDLFYVYTSKLDLVAGYRVRWSQTDLEGDTYDHWFSVGATGGLFAKLTGTIRVGYQIRNQQNGSSFNHVNAMAGLSWPVTRKLGFTGQLNRDFNTIATGSSVDSSSATLRATFAFTRKLEMSAGLAYGRNLFLGFAPPERRDRFFSFDAGAHYELNDHLRLGATYTYFRNWSTLAFSEFDRQMMSFDVSSRY